MLVAVVSKSTAVSSAVSGDGALSSGADAGGADREGGEAGIVMLVVTSPVLKSQLSIVK